MGTSGAFGGSGGKAAKDLRDSIADWLDSPPPAPGDSPATLPGQSPTPGNPPVLPVPSIDLRPTIHIISGRGGGGDGPGGGGGGVGRTGGGTRSNGGARRSASGLSRAAGRAGALARAYATGDRVVLERAGLNYDELRALGDPVNIGAKIVNTVFDSTPDSTIENSEEWDIAAAVAGWILEAPADAVPSLDEIVRKSIELILLEVTLTEVGDRIRAEASFDKRQAAEQEIADAAEIYASQVTLAPAGPSDQEMTTAIEGGIQELGRIFGVAE